MWVNARVGLGIVVAMAACGQVEPQDAAPAVQAVDQAETGLPTDPNEQTCGDDKTKCSPSNGPGIYTAEYGRAGIGGQSMYDGPAFMITHFMNTTSGVKFTGVYQPRPPLWLAMPNDGTVDSVELNQHTYTPISITETSTDLAVMVNNNGPHPLDLQSGGPLKLHISVSNPGSGLKRYVLDITPASVVLPLSTGTSMHTYAMSWTIDPPDSNIEPAFPYCYDEQNNPEPVVFQQGIDVNPFDGSVSRSSSTTVTMSCRQSAIAVVYSWGYPYLGDPADTYYYDAGIHMKRASYCGDDKFYTKPNTLIGIRDNAAIDSAGTRTLGSINNTIDLTQLEAEWSPSGATCIHRPLLPSGTFGAPDHLRHPDFDPPFDGTCSGRDLPACTPTTRAKLSNSK